MKKTNHNRVLYFGILLIVCVFLLGSGGCKRMEIPNAIITISNECGVTIDFILNGDFQFSLEYEQERSIENLPDGTHVLEANRTGTGEFVAREELFMIINKIYTWTVLSSANINIINNYGQDLGIYGDNVYSGTVSDQSNVTLLHVPYGDHLLEAKTTEDTVVATTTISVLGDNTYEWTITK